MLKYQGRRPSLILLVYRPPAVPAFRRSPSHKSLIFRAKDLSQKEGLFVVLILHKKGAKVTCRPKYGFFHLIMTLLFLSITGSTKWTQDKKWSEDSGVKSRIMIFFFSNIEYAITWLKFDHQGLDYPDFSINGIRFYGPIFMNIN